MQQRAVGGAGGVHGDILQQCGDGCGRQGLGRRLEAGPGRGASVGALLGLGGGQRDLPGGHEGGDHHRLPPLRRLVVHPLQHGAQHLHQRGHGAGGAAASRREESH